MMLYLSSEDSDRRTEEIALQNLGAAVVLEWRHLPSEVRHRLQQAASRGPLPDPSIANMWESIRDVLHRNGTLLD